MTNPNDSKKPRKLIAVENIACGSRVYIDENGHVFSSSFSSIGDCTKCGMPLTGYDYAKMRIKSNPKSNEKL